MENKFSVQLQMTGHRRHGHHGREATIETNPCTGKQVYAARHRAEWLGKIGEPGVRRRAKSNALTVKSVQGTSGKATYKESRFWGCSMTR
jgi:hypothetical protein